MPRDFRSELRRDRCWDHATQAVLEEHGEPLIDGILQNREEIIGLCELIEAQNVRSYLEIGIWTGRLVSALQRLFDFDLVAACDHGWAERWGLSIDVPSGTRMFRGDSDSDAYLKWRADLGHVDLVLIDANHSYTGVMRDFYVNRRFPHRFLAFHDICGASRQTAGVRRFWNELSEGRLGEGHTLEIVRPHAELGLDRSTMGIGIWSSQAISWPGAKGSFRGSAAAL